MGVLSGTCIASTNTRSQVCDLLWSQNADEITSAHGYLGNEVCIWRGQGLSKVGILSNRMARALCLAVSADGQTIITGAADQTIRCWRVFPPCMRATAHPSQAIAGLGSSFGRLTIR